MREVRASRAGKAALVGMLWWSVLPVHAAPPWLHVEGNKIKDPSGHEVVLRGIALPDLGVLQLREGGALNMIDRLTNPNDPQSHSPGWYPKVLRLTIHPADGGWSPLHWSANDDSYYTNLLRPIVDYCAQKNLYAIIDWHYIDDTGPKMAQTSEFWRYMAPRFAHDSHVLFELFNEPMDNYGSERQRWLNVRADMQTWVNLVRSYAPNNLILVGGGQWCQILSYTVTDPMVGSNIVYVSHYYPAHWLNIWLNQPWIVNQLETCTAAHPVMMTEWGFYKTTETLLNGTVTNYGQPLVDLMERLGIGSTAWVASYDWRPPMFWPDWTLRCGDGEMGGFVKDMLYQKRNDRQPQGIAQPLVGPVGLALEDFETKNFERYPWVLSGSTKWHVTNQQQHTGLYSAESGAITGNEKSVLQVTLACVPGAISFYAKTSSGWGGDRLRFFIDGVEQARWSGKEGWVPVSFPVAPGVREFKWVYANDTPGREGFGTAWIDDIVFPLGLSGPAAVSLAVPDINGFDLYQDAVAPGISATPALNRFLEYTCHDQPAVGTSCIHWTGAEQHGTISFTFAPLKDLSLDVAQGLVVHLWVRCQSPGVRLGLHFVEGVITGDGHHFGCMGYTLDQTTAHWDGQWHHLQIPLDQFARQALWENGCWYAPIGTFDYWPVIERFEIASDDQDLKGIHLYFDGIRVGPPTP